MASVGTGCHRHPSHQSGSKARRVTSLLGRSQAYSCMFCLRGEQGHIWRPPHCSWWARGPPGAPLHTRASAAASVNLRSGGASGPAYRPQRVTQHSTSGRRTPCAFGRAPGSEPPGSPALSSALCMVLGGCLHCSIPSSVSRVTVAMPQDFSLKIKDVPVCRAQTMPPGREQRTAGTEAYASADAGSPC